MNPADSVIEKLGGVSAVAKATGAHRTRVSNWKRPREAGGTGGRIPQKHFPKLIELANQIGVKLEVAEIVGMAPSEAAQAHTGGAPCA